MFSLTNRGSTDNWIILGEPFLLSLGWDGATQLIRGRNKTHSYNFSGLNTNISVSVYNLWFMHMAYGTVNQFGFSDLN